MITEEDIKGYPHEVINGAYMFRVGGVPEPESPLPVVTSQRVCPYCGSDFTGNGFGIGGWTWTKYLCGTAAAIRVPTIGDWLLLGITPQTAECRVLFDVSAVVNGVDDII